MRFVAFLLFLSSLLLPGADARAQCGGDGSALLEIISVDGQPIGPGSQITLRLSGPAGDVFCLVCDVAPGSTTLPGIGTFCLPFSPLFQEFVGVIPQSGFLEVNTTIPAQSSPSTQICCQAFTAAAGSPAVNISNLVCVCLGAECDGKVTDLSLVTSFNVSGSFPVTVVGAANKKESSGELLGQTTVAYDPSNPPAFPISDDGILIIENIAMVAGELAVVTRLDASQLSNGELPSETFFAVDVDQLQNSQKIHTSCSKPLAVGMVFGPFTVTGIDTTNNPCPAAVPPTQPTRSPCGGDGGLLLEIVSPQSEVIGPGTQVVIEITGKPGDHFCLVCDSTTEVTALPPLGTICVPFSAQAIEIAGVLPPSGVVRQTVTIGDDPSIIGEQLCCQVLSLDVATSETSVSNLICICMGFGCDGKVTELSHLTDLAYSGPFPVTVDAGARKKDSNGERLGDTSVVFDPSNPPVFPISTDGVYFIDNIAYLNGQLTVLSGIVAQQLKDGELPSSTFFEVRAGGLVNSEEIHTSCSRPLGVGFMFGDFLVTSLNTTEKGSVCGGNKPVALRMRYTGEDCSATKTAQESSKVSCSGDPNSAATVLIRASDDQDPTKSGAKVWFMGQVGLNSEFEIDARNAGETKLDSETWVHVFDATGTTLLQTVEFHTSCSQPLRIGDQFGCLELAGFVPGS